MEVANNSYLISKTREFPEPTLQHEFSILEFVVVGAEFFVGHSVAHHMEDRRQECVSDGNDGFLRTSRSLLSEIQVPLS